MKIQKTMLVLSLILCILFGISCVAASDADSVIAGDANGTALASDVDDVQVASTDENPVIEQANDEVIIGSGSEGTFTELQLRIALADDGDTIKLDKDYAYDDKFPLTTGIFINKDLTIDGNGHTIDGKSISRIFNINYGSKNDLGIFKANKVTLKNIVFKNGKAKYYGGAILSFGQITVDGCTFSGNYAPTAGGAINSLGTLTLKNSKFDKNTADGDAGAVFSLTIHKSLEFYMAYFEGRNATEDSNLLLTIMQAVVSPGKDTISNCVFTNNVANGRGGGAVYAYTHIDIDSCTFDSNKAGEKGGAVFGCKDLYIENSKFNKNSVSMYGGAVYFKSHESTGKYDENGKWVSSYVFYSNLIQDSTFTNNKATQRGGAIYGFLLSDSDKTHCAKAVRCTFEGNSAAKGRDIYGGTTSNCVFKYWKLTMKKVKVKKSAKKLVLKAKLTKWDPVKGKKIKFKFNGKKYTAKTNKKGIAKVTIKKKVLKKLKVGKKVKYQAKYGKLCVKYAVKVKK